MKHTGKLIILAFPDTFVTMSTEWICKVLPLVGLGTKEYIKAGHAALVLIENETGKVRYFDFGRYVTPKGHGRVRSASTDAELHMPMTAQLSADHTLQNLDEILVWLDANPQKTHGEGRLLASVCDAIDYAKAEAYILELQKRGSIPYGVFGKTGSNCARFVTDTILASTNDKKIIKALNFNKKFTPSTVGNVEKANTLQEAFQVRDGKVELFEGSALKENLTNYFHKKKTESTTAALMATTERTFSKKFQFQKLSGTGSNAWFEIVATDLPAHHFNIKRYNDLGELDYNGVYISTKFNFSLPYQFTYDSHCEFCTIVQNGEKIKLESLGTLAQFNSLQKQRSA
ncbi:DUF6695 family protein [Rasiella sp. SM2506]|uniref:DUF6695 family protein n=1 Tax=Rasiella sp. SM2506 TaxID=3423914 RepID=UPI003D7924FD